MELTKYRLADIHAHVVPCVDDGPASMDIALQMIQCSYLQGVRDIFCTSHSWGDHEAYKRNLITLQQRIATVGLDIRLHSGCEIDASFEDIQGVVRAVHSGRYPTLGNSDYVLMEFDRYTEEEELLSTIRQYIEHHNNHIVLAHIERLYCLYENETLLDLLQSLGCLFQLNAYSLVEEAKESTRKFARKMIDQQRITFIGSDAHRINHRPPNVSSGVEYIYKQCSTEYADAICYKNAENLLISRH